MTNNIVNASFYEMFVHEGEEQDISTFNPIVDISFDIKDYEFLEDGTKKLTPNHTTFVRYFNGEVKVTKYSELTEEEKEFLSNNTIRYTRTVDVNADIYQYLNKKKSTLSDKIKGLFEDNKLNVDNLEDPKEYYWLEYYNGLYQNKQHNFKAFAALLKKYGSPTLRNPYNKNEKRYFNYHSDILINVDIEKYLTYYIQERKNINRFCSLLKIVNEFELENKDLRDRIVEKINKELSQQDRPNSELNKPIYLGESNVIYEELNLVKENEINRDVKDFQDIENLITEFIKKRDHYLIARKALLLNLIYGDGINEDMLSAVDPENILMLYAILISDISYQELKEEYQTADYFERFRLDMKKRIEDLNLLLENHSLPPFKEEIFDKIMNSKITYEKEGGRLPFFLVEYIILELT